MDKKVHAVFWLLQASFILCAMAQTIKEYNMDEFATCGRTLTVDDTGIRMIGRGNAAPSNPPTECIVYLQSVYARDDGSNKLQIKIESLTIKDCNVKVDLYNGRTSVGQTLRALSCQYSSTDLIYSTGREITIKFSRPDKIMFNDYQFSLEIKPFKDQDVPGTKSGVEALSVGAIIAIVIGCLVVVALMILFLWCCCTGRLGNLNVPGLSLSSAASKEKDKSAIISEKSQSTGAAVYKNQAAWSNMTTGKYEPAQEPGPRLYQRGVPRNSAQMGRRFDNNRDGLYRNYSAARDSLNRSSHEYEQYGNERRRNEAEEERRKNERKETLIDDVFDSESVTKDSEMTSDTADNHTEPRRSPAASPRLKKKDVSNIPEETMDEDSPQMERYLSMDLQSQPDSSTISSPLHVNAAVRSSVEENIDSPKGSPRRKDRSPRARRRGDGKEPDPLALPPEAFEPIFTKPISGIDYKGNQLQYAAPYGYAGGVIPYGLIPAGAYAPGIPGSQMYAYAYQTHPSGGVPGQPVSQGAVFVQNTPTNEGTRRTAFAVEETVSPENHKHRKVDPFQHTKLRDSNRSWQIADRLDAGSLDLSVIARGAAPPLPGQGHRSVSMRTGTDAVTGVHTTQVMWTDTVADPTDPKPHENPQITRKTITRVTTKSGHGELPPQTSLLELEDEEPAFLSPSAGRSQKAIMPTAQTSGGENIAFYLGDSAHHSVAPPERSSTPTSVNHLPSYNRAIRDRIPLDDSTV